MKPNLILFNQELSRVSAAACSSRVRVRRARTLREIAQHMDVHIRPEFRCLKHIVTELRRLHQDAEHRAAEIVQAQIAGLKSLPSPIEQKARIELFRATEWCLLPGRFPRLSRAAEAASKALHSRRLGDSSSITDVVRRERVVFSRKASISSIA